MAIIRLQGDREKNEGIYYEFDDASKPLGEGGMGKVFRGRLVNAYTQTSREVAIKFMFAGLPPNVIQRAENEAAIRIQNENLVEMMGFLKVESQAANGTITYRYHVVSELLIGVSLSDLIQGNVNDQNGVPIPYAQQLYKQYNDDPSAFAVTIITKVLSGIMALHDAGYIHRDIDPSNIMITRDGKVKLIDFGIAKRVDGLISHDRNLTSAGQFLGKPQYAAPELIIGDLKNQGKHTDIYAIGVLLFQLITGHLPFEGPANVVLGSHMHKKLPVKQIQDSKLRKVVSRATQKDPTLRYHSAAEFRAALDTGKGDGKPNYKKIGIIASIVVAIAAIVVLCLPGKVSETTPVPPPTPEDSLNIVVVRQWLQNPSMANKGFDNLNKLVESGNLNAKFVLSQLYAVSDGAFTVGPEFMIMQENLKKTVKQDQAKTHQLLLEIVEKEPNYYPALYELACDYYLGRHDPNDMDVVKAKTLLDRAYTVADKENDVVYKNKISALLRRY